MSQSQPPPDSAVKTMHVKVYAPFKIYYDAPATSVTAVNRVGQFDVLQGHHNFISLLTPGEVTIRAEGMPDFKMNIDHGLIHVKADEVKLFLDV
jgi:F0F1-type ATP synthase epsilon subunit